MFGEIEIGHDGTYAVKRAFLQPKKVKVTYQVLDNIETSSHNWEASRDDPDIARLGLRDE